MPEGFLSSRKERQHFGQEKWEFVPPQGMRYFHLKHHMVLYEPAREWWGEERFKQVTGQPERYLYPDHAPPKLIMDFSSLPFSALGSLWAYRTMNDFERGLAAWSGSAVMVQPHCAVTAAHCLCSRITEDNPEIFVFLLHQSGRKFTSRRNCLGFKVPEEWINTPRGTDPPENKDYALVYFSPVTEAPFGCIDIQREKTSLVAQHVRVSGYPEWGDCQLALMSEEDERLVPNRLYVRLENDCLIYKTQHINGSIYTGSISKEHFFQGFPKENDLSAFQAIQGEIFTETARRRHTRFLGEDTSSFMYDSDGFVLRDVDGLVMYNANTLSGQSGGSGVVSCQLEQGLGVVLDFLHTTGGSSPSEGNAGVKVYNEVADDILRWSTEALAIVEKQQQEETARLKEEEEKLRAEGRAEGEAIGRAEEVEKIARGMIVNGESNETITKQPSTTS